MTSKHEHIQKHTNNMRLGLIHNVPHSSVQSEGRRISLVVQHALENLSLTMAKNFLFKILREENVPRVTASFKNLAEFSVGVSCSSICFDRDTGVLFH